MSSKTRIGIVASHPIQHFCPQYVNWAADSRIQLKVFFGSALGLKKYKDGNFQQEVSWGNLNLDKFHHVFLNGDRVIEPDRHLDSEALENELLNYDPEVLIIYGYFQKLQRRAYRWCRKNKVLIGYVSDSELRQHRNWASQLVKSILLCRYFSKVSYFLTMGNANEDYYRSHGVDEHKIVRMHYPIDIVEYNDSYQAREALRNKVRTRYGISDDETVLSVVGKLVPWKNQDHLIDAAKSLEQEGVAVSLFIIGSGEMRDAWEQKARQLQKSKVHFTGFVGIEDLPAYYAASDIYIHPASIEPHSVAVSEAIYMGCPVILSDRCGSYGATDDVQEGRNGYVYPFGNIPALAARIKQMISDDVQRRAFGEHSHSIAVKFQENSHYRVLEKLLARIPPSKSKN